MKKIISLCLVAFVFAFTSCEEKSAPSKEPTSTKKTEPERKRQAKPLINQIPEVIEQANEQPYDKGVKKNARIKVSTDFGDMVLRLYDETPRHRDNFLRLAREGFYNGTLFHRVMQGFMIQGGDPDSENARAGQKLGMGGPGYQIPAEINPNFIHKKGALSAARTGGPSNPNKRSSGSQYYIVQGKVASDAELNQTENKKKNFEYTDEQREIYKTIGGAPFLDMDYTVYGEIESGLEVIDKIAAVQTDKSNRPLKDVKMIVTIIQE